MLAINTAYNFSKSGPSNEKGTLLLLGHECRSIVIEIRELEQVNKAKHCVSMYGIAMTDFFWGDKINFFYSKFGKLSILP